jgi:hypothetical protein
MARSVDIWVDPRLEALVSQASAAARRRALQQIIIHWGEYATAMQRIYAPRGESAELQQGIGMTLPREYLPGGAGGGGSYQVTSGVRRTVRHAMHVHFGTANPGGLPGRALFMVGGTGEAQGRIYPRGGATAARHIYRSQREFQQINARGRRGRGIDDFTYNQRAPALTFQKRGEPRKFRAWVSGQRPNPFVYRAFMTTAVYAKGQLRAIARGMFSGRP